MVYVYVYDEITGDKTEDRWKNQGKSIIFNMCKFEPR